MSMREDYFLEDCSFVYGIVQVDRFPLLYLVLVHVPSTTKVRTYRGTLVHLKAENKERIQTSTKNQKGRQQECSLSGGGGSGGTK
jgi:hypothetical protein